VNESDGLCYFQGLVLQLAYTSVSVWVSIISFNLCYALICVRKIPWYFEIVYHGILWPIVILSCIPPIVTDDYGPAGSWCWIKSDYYGYIWRFVCFYVPLYCYLLLNLMVYVVIIIRVGMSFYKTYGYKSDGSRLRDKLVFGKLILFPLVYVCLWILPLANRIYNWSTNDENPQFGLLILHTLSLGFQAPLFLFVYGLNPSIRRDYVHLVKYLLNIATCKKFRIFHSKNKGMQRISMKSSADGDTPEPTENFSPDDDSWQGPRDRTSTRHAHKFLGQKLAEGQPLDKKTLLGSRSSLRALVTPSPQARFFSRSKKDEPNDKYVLMEDEETRPPVGDQNNNG